MFSAPSGGMENRAAAAAGASAQKAAAFGGIRWKTGAARHGGDNGAARGGRRHSRHHRIGSLGLRANEIMAYRQSVASKIMKWRQQWPA
jgi:hypothetical protein